MSSTPPENLIASVKQRLLNIAREDGADFNAILSLFVMERLLFRLSMSPYSNNFYLKGAMLFAIWEKNPHRPTKDLDLLSAEAEDRHDLEQIFKDIVSIRVEDDALLYDPQSIVIEEIREENAYGGLRLKLISYLGKAKIPLQIDIGLGDSVYPLAAWSEFPSLLEFSKPRIRVYPTETVIAEKFQAMVDLQLRNSRMKDYYDIHYLLRKFRYSGNDLREAIVQTFRRRRTIIPTEIPVGLSDRFAEDSQKQTNWKGFIRKNRLQESGMWVG